MPLFCEAVFRFSFVFLGKPILETSLCFINFLSLSDSLFVTLSITTRGVKYLHNNTLSSNSYASCQTALLEKRDRYIYSVKETD